MQQERAGLVTSSTEGNLICNYDSPKMLTNSDTMTDEKPLKYKRCQILGAEMHPKKRKANPDANLIKKASTSYEGVDESNATVSLRPVTYYLLFKISTLIEKWQIENNFHEALCDLIELLKLKCFKQKKINLFSIMRSIYFHALHLVGRQQMFELDVTKSKSDLVKHTTKISKLLINIVNVFKLSLEENCWCCFTNNQKHYIELYEKHCIEWKMQFIEEVVPYQNVFDEQQNQSKENIDLHKENALEDFEEQNHENNFTVVIREKHLNNEEIFFENENILITWLEKEECTTKIAKSFLSMMHCIHNHVAKLLSNTNECEEKSRGTLIKNFKKTLCNLTKMEKILDSLEQCRNHFSFAEWKNIELCRKYAEELRLNIENKLNEFQDKVDENETNIQSFKQLKNLVHQLEESNKNLQYQCKEVQNDIIAMKSNHEKDLQRLDAQTAVIQRDIQNAKKEISKLREEQFINEIEIKELRKTAEQHELIKGPAVDPHYAISPNVARIIALVSIYLNVFHGATMDYICSYLHQIDSTIDGRIAEGTIRRFPSLFREDITGTGADLKKRWHFTGYQT